VILVDGTTATITPATVDALRRLGVTSVAIAGGTGAVSAGIETQLRDLGYTVTRLGGADRYQTAALINQRFFTAGSTPAVFLATGSDFPDALAGAALAGRLGAPVFVTWPSCVPADVTAVINALAAPARVVMGGTAVVSDAAANLTVCTTPSPSPSPTPTPTPTGPPPDKDCSDFKTQREAQEFFDRWFPYFGDFADLDRDGNGRACETLP
jgi:hypothetical protein